MHILESVKAYVTDYISKNVSPEYVFHNIIHTEQVVAGVIEISEELHFSKDESEMMQIAAWFHDIGYDKGQDGHENRGIEYAKKFLTQHSYPSEHIATIEEAITATKMPQSPKSLYDKVLCDADMSHLGKKTYWERSGKIRHELVLTIHRHMTEEEWLEFELSFMLKHNYHLPVAEMLYGRRKQKNIKLLLKQQNRLNPVQVFEKTVILSSPYDDDNKEHHSHKHPRDLDIIEEKRLVRGVETMFKTTYQTHNNLSALADHKANMMLSINTIVLSIIASTLIPKIMDSSHTKLIIPAILLMFVCLVSIVFATLSTRPKITEGHVKREDIISRKSNLLFFGNFYNMKLNEFQWGVKEMIKDPDFLYNSMSRDIYFLGVVLSKKYRYLSICYNIFMYGLIISVLAFALAFLF
ncbi:MAG: Pycsar system effector family protein [Saprospiraceae bacterium]